MVKCQHSGIEFEAKSKRSKNHPQVSELKNGAAKDGNYTEVLKAMDTIREQGKYETIDEFLAQVQDIVNVKARRKADRQRKQREFERKAEQAHRDAKAKREATNRHLREHGYKWSKEYADLDEYEEGEPSKWVLRSLDRREVTVAQALDEIERGADAVQDKLAGIIESGGELPYDVVLDGKLEEAEAKRKQAEEAEEDAYRMEWEKAKNEIKAGMVEVERFDYDNFEITFDRARTQHSARQIERIHRGKVNGVDCAVIYRYFGGHDFIETEQFYSADPEQANLARIERDELEAGWHRFFGE